MFLSEVVKLWIGVTGRSRTLKGFVESLKKMTLLPSLKGHIRVEPVRGGG